MSGNNRGQNNQAKKAPQAQNGGQSIQSAQQAAAQGQGKETPIPTPTTPTSQTGATQTTSVSSPVVETPEIPPAVQTDAEQIAAAPKFDFAAAVEGVIEASDDQTVKLHVKNLIHAVGKLLTIKSVRATTTTYAEAAQLLVSVTRSLSMIDDAAFIKIFPAILDAMQDAAKDKEVVFTHPVNAFKILSNTSAEVRGLQREHMGFVAIMQELMPAQTRARRAKELDLANNFAILPDVKRTVIKQIYR